MSTAHNTPARPTDLHAFDAQVQRWRDDLTEAVAIAKLTGPQAERAAAAIPVIRMQLADAQAVYDADPWPRWVYQYVGNVLHRDGCTVARKSYAVPALSGRDDADGAVWTLPGAVPCPTCCPDATAATRRPTQPRRFPGAARSMDEFGYLPGPRRARDSRGRSTDTKPRSVTLADNSR